METLIGKKRCQGYTPIHCGSSLEKQNNFLKTHIPFINARKNKASNEKLSIFKNKGRGKHLSNPNIH